MVASLTHSPPRKDKEMMVDRKCCKNCKWFTHRILPPDNIGICKKAEEFTQARWQDENREACNKWEDKNESSCGV